MRLAESAAAVNEQRVVLCGRLPGHALCGCVGHPVWRPNDEGLQTPPERLGWRDGPTALALTRQKLPVLVETKRNAAETVARGAYVLVDSSGIPDVILIATGSEVALALEARDLLAEKGVAVRVVSMPSWELFDAQPEEYRNTVLPPKIRARISIEAGTPLGWERYVGLDGIAIGLSRFGASAPGKVIYEKLGLTAQHMVDEALKLLQRRKI